MVTEAQIRKFALAMPGAEEKSHFGQADFRVGGKIFCTLQVKHARSGLKLDPEEMQSLIRMDPEAFAGAPGFERHGWTLVRWAKVTPAQMKSLVADAWERVAKAKAKAKPGSKGRKPSPGSDGDRRRAAGRGRK